MPSLITKQKSGLSAFLIIYIVAVLILTFLPAPAYAATYLNLDGTDDRAEATATIYPDSSTLQSFTVEAWIYPTASGACHNGEKAFSQKDGANCSKCHVK